MMKPGIMEEDGNSTDDMMLNYFKLIKAMTPCVASMVALRGQLLPGLGPMLHVFSGLQFVIHVKPLLAVNFLQ